MKGITKLDYKHTQRTRKSFVDYHNLYVQNGTLLLI